MSITIEDIKSVVPDVMPKIPLTSEQVGEIARQVFDEATSFVGPMKHKYGLAYLVASGIHERKQKLAG